MGEYMRIKIVSIGLLVLVLIVTSFCSKNEAEWKGTIEVQHGVMIVKNPKEPMYQQNVFQLKEEITIGEAEGREEYMFSGLLPPVLNNNGDIYVLDKIDKKVKVFNKFGQYLKTFGTEGQGPGEISGLPVYFALNQQNELFIIDSSGVSFFSLDGEYLRKILNNDFKTHIIWFDMDRSSNAYILQRSSNKQGFELNKYDPFLKILKTIEYSPTQGIENIRKNGWNPFFPVLMYKTVEDGRIFCGRNDSYEIRIYGGEETELEMRLQKIYEPIKFSQKHIEKYLVQSSPSEIKSLNLPTFLPPFKYIQSDEKKRIFIATFESEDKTNQDYYDVFDEEGKYLVKITLPSYPVFKENNLYTVEEDDDGYQFVKRYKVTWNY